MTEPFQFTNGTRNAKVILVGEAWGEKEDYNKKPFCGWSGYKLAKMLAHRGVIPKAPPVFEKQIPSLMFIDWWRQQPVFLTNVFPFRPKDNKIPNICLSKAEVKEIDKEYNKIAWDTGKYIHPQHLSELNRLKIEIESVKPNLIIALGKTATWALLDDNRIKKRRGWIEECVLTPGIKILPTFHPANVLYNPSEEVTMLRDLEKAEYEMKFPEIIYPEREIFVDPTIEEVEEFTNNLLRNPPEEIALDIETDVPPFEMISIATSPFFSFVIPFRDKLRDNFNYWKDKNDEIRAMKCLDKILQSEIPKVWQNGAAFDMIRLDRIGLKINANRDDTMLLSHAIWPEREKGLKFLGSYFCNDRNWAEFRQKQEEKRDA